MIFLWLLISIPVLFSSNLDVALVFVFIVRSCWRIVRYIIVIHFLIARSCLTVFSPRRRLS